MIPIAITSYKQGRWEQVLQKYENDFHFFVCKNHETMQFYVSKMFGDFKKMQGEAERWRKEPVWMWVDKNDTRERKE